MKIYLRLEAPFEWVRMNGTNVEAFGEVAELNEYPISEDEEAIGVVPGEWVTNHRVSLPAKTKKQFNAALPYALEESISEDIENMHFVCPNWKSGEECNVFVVSKAKMQQWQALANDNRLPLVQLLPDYVLVPFHDAAESSVALCGNHVLASHQNGHGVTIDPDFLDAWIMDMPMSSTIAVNDESLIESLITRHSDRDFRLWSFGHKMAHWLEYRIVPMIDLWTESYRPSVSRLKWRSFAIPLAIVCFSIIGKFGFDSYRYLSLHAEVRAVHTESKQLIKATFPEIDVIEDGYERFIMEQAIARRTGADDDRNLQTMLSETAQVLRRQNVTMSDLVYRDSELVITCLVRDFSQVDRLTQQLNQRPRIQAVLQSSSADDGEITASYLLKHT